MIYDEEQNWIGVEVGIETGSARLARSIMPAKAAPYKVDEWPDIVEDAFTIMHVHNKYQQRRSYSASQVREEDVAAT